MRANIQLFQEMHSGMLHLTSEMQRPKLKNYFVIGKYEVQLTLTDNYIILQQNSFTRVATFFCQLTFDTKFEVLYHPIQDIQSIGIPFAIKLERQYCSEQLILESPHPSINQKKELIKETFISYSKQKKKIGKGAFATVYLAQRLRDHKMVAVKAFSKQKQYSSDKGKQSLQNQIKLMRKLNHDNIMRLEGVYETENSIYIILQYLEGLQLNQIIKNGKKLNSEQIKSIIQNILRGLSHLAENRIIHRDLKPENIMFRKLNSQHLALCDFGLATHADQQKYLFVRCGTPGFVAPEIINIKDMSTKSDPISDVFSAGVIFHYLLLGCSVFQGKKYNQILTENRSCIFDFSKQIYSNINPFAVDLLTKMLEKDPSKRMPANLALKHPYFSSNMDIEYQQKTVFKEIVNKSPIFLKRCQQTPTCTTKKREDKLSFFPEPTKRQINKLFQYS